LGYFIFKGLEIEPEFIFTIPDESKNTGYFLMGNLAYNFKTSGKTMPFVLAGVGYGNGEPLLSWTMDLDTGVTAYNLGAGIKYLVGDSAAVRVEYRFTHYAGKKTETWENEYYSYSYTNIYDRTDHQVLVGISLFF
jgi:opacity protein-like surface antigen